MKRPILERLIAERDAGAAVALVTDLESGRQALVFADRCEGELPVDAATALQAREATARERGGTVDTPAGRLFVHPFCPPVRLIVVGAVHIAEPLSQIAVVAGYRVTLVDPRRAFASRSSFEGVTVLDDWPDEALERLRPDPRTAVVTLTHDPKLDDAALDAALRSPAFYVGALGSRKTHAARRHRLARRGFSDSELARIHGPVGLDIGAVLPAEIAVSILADIIRARRRATG
ncbi:MAG: XdhC family protein [Rhodospirillales bacterium]